MSWTDSGAMAGTARDLIYYPGVPRETGKGKDQLGRVMLQWVVRDWHENKGSPHARDILGILVTWGNSVLSGATQPLCLSATLSHCPLCIWEDAQDYIWVCPVSKQ